MRLSIVTDTFYPDINGVAKTLERLSSELYEKGHEIEIFHPSTRKDDSHAKDNYSFDLIETPGVPLVIYPGLRLGLPQMKRFQKRWSVSRPDIVYVATQGLLGLSAVLVANKLNIPVVSGYHSNFPDYIRHYIEIGCHGINPIASASKKYLRYFHNLTKCTLVPTCSVATELQNSGINKIMKLGRGIDLERFSPVNRSEILRQQLKISPHEIFILMVSRIAKEKNLILGIKTALDLQLKFSTVRCVVVGDGPLRQKLEAQFPQVIWTGTLEGETLAAYYASADLFLFPSLTETYGNVLLEALASGLIPVSFNYAAAKELIIDGKNGFVATFGDDAQFFSKAVQALEKRQLWTRIQRAGLSTAQQYSWDRISYDFETVLKKNI
ncbi:MAG: glycosyltransferase family 1 protein [Cyanobacteria bacterium P01_D01_bin.105]